MRLKALVDDTWVAITREEPSKLGDAIERLGRAIAAHEHGERRELPPALAAAFPDPTAYEAAARKLLLV